MELRLLRYFITVAREESITHAADALHVTQPTLSRQLTNLEEELGTQLLIRGKRKISLTDAGMLLLQRAEEILTIADKTEKEFRDQQNLVGGEISIGSVEAITSQMLSKLLKAFSAEYSQVSYNIFSGTADDIKEKIDKGILDIGILLEPVNLEKYNFIRLQQKERWGILMKTSSPLAQKEYVTAKDLIEVPLISPSRSIVQNELASWFGDYYEHLHFLATCNLIFNTASLVENGLGHAICIEGALTNFNSLCFRPLHPKLLSGSLIVWKKHKVFSPTTARFIEFIKHALQA